MKQLVVLGEESLEAPAFILSCIIVYDGFGTTEVPDLKWLLKSDLWLKETRLTNMNCHLRVLVSELRVVPVLDSCDAHLR
jgi:hypothetical protein